MSYRVTNNISFGTTQSQLADQTLNLFNARTQLATGKRYADGTEAPGDYARSLELQHAVTDSDRFTRASQQVSTNLQGYDHSLDSLSSIMTQARQIAVRGANDTGDQTAKNLLAKQVDTLLQEAIKTANTFQDGHYIYGGSNNGSPPYVAVQTNGVTTGIQFNGDSRDQTVNLETGVSITATVSGTEVFGDPPGNPSNYLGSLMKLRDDLRGGNSATVSSDIAAMDGVNDKLLATRGDVGIRLQHLTNLQNFREQTLNDLKAEKSSIDDVDMAQAATNLSRSQVGYQASLMVASQLQRNTLIDMLRSG